MNIKQIITIHPYSNAEKYGYESSQLSRMNVAKKLNCEYLHVLTYPHVDVFWQKRYLDMGFDLESLILVPNFYSDCGHDEPSLKIWDLPDYLQEGEIVLVDGFVGKVVLDDCTWYVTSAPYLRELNNGDLEWYNRDGSLVMKARKFNPMIQPTPFEMYSEGYCYYKDDKWFSFEDLLLPVLLNVIKEGSLIIKDKYDLPTPKLWRFVDFHNLNYYEFIHNNVLLGNIPLLRKKTKYLVASEQLTLVLEKMGYKASFMPPILLENRVQSFVKDRHRRFCFVGNLSDNKRFDIVLAVFDHALDVGLDIELDVYGKGDDMGRFDIPENVNIKGYVKDVPYGEYDGYISSSESELFANTCVEAMSYGLTCFVSDVDFAHRYYEKEINDDSIIKFNSASELFNLLNEYNTKTVSNKKMLDFVKRYSAENINDYYDL